jgi:signal transduction histidine kinase
VSAPERSAPDAEIRALIDDVANQLCEAVYGIGDLLVHSDGADPTVDKLVMTTNLVLDTARRAIREREKAAEDVRRSQAQLVRAEKMSSLGMMVTGVAHELNNPMMGILNFAQYCARHTDPQDKRYPVLKDIEREIHRCAGIVKDLLTFSRVGVIEKPIQADVGEVIRETLRLLAFRLTATRVQISLEVDDDAPRIALRVGSFKQAILNLLANAIDACRAPEIKEPRVRVYVSRCPGGLVVEVTDNGPGMSPDTLQRLFDPFFTTKPIGEGTGLGLSVTQGIVATHGGTIEAHSELGRGASFVIRLPEKAPEPARA